MAEALLAAGANANTMDEYGESPLTLAAANGDARLVQRLLAAGANANTTRWNGETALMMAAGAGSVDAVRQLVLRGADVNAADPRRGQTALMWAAAEGHADVVEALIEIGADVKAVSKNGFSPLVFAVTKNSVPSMKALLAAGADPNQPLASGSLPLVVAMSYRAYRRIARAARGRGERQHPRSDRQHAAARRVPAGKRCGGESAAGERRRSQRAYAPIDGRRRWTRRWRRAEGSEWRADAASDGGQGRSRRGDEGARRVPAPTPPCVRRMARTW